MVPQSFHFNGAVVLNLDTDQDHRERLIKSRLLSPTPEVSDRFSTSDVASRICTSNKFPLVADADGPGTTR